MVVRFVEKTSTNLYAQRMLSSLLRPALIVEFMHVARQPLFQCVDDNEKRIAFSTWITQIWECAAATTTRSCGRPAIPLLIDRKRKNRFLSILLRTHVGQQSSNGQNRVYEKAEYQRLYRCMQHIRTCERRFLITISSWTDVWKEHAWVGKVLVVIFSRFCPSRFLLFTNEEIRRTSVTLLSLFISLLRRDWRLACARVSGNRGVRSLFPRKVTN